MRSSFFAAIALACAACAVFGPAEQAQVEGIAGQIASCQSVALACKADGGAPADCWNKYDGCMRDAGLHE